jgi:hypothetical protein
VTVVGWIVVAVLAAAVVWLGFAMAGLLREVASLREELQAVARGPLELGGGLPVGSVPEPWAVETADGTLRSSSFTGSRHVVVFADTECATCSTLVPEIVDATSRGDLPPVVVVARDGDRLPSAWTGPGVLAGVEHEREVSDAFDVDVSPHVFVLDEEGAIVGQGGATTVADVETLVADAQGIRIVRRAGDG